jgi:nucleoside-diphosphate-sugar epimerase
VPSTLSPLGALPARFRKPRVLIVGCGDVGVRLLKAFAGQVRWMATTSQSARIAGLRALGAAPLTANLDDPATLRRLAGLAHRVLHLAPPPPIGMTDPRTLALVQALRQRGNLRSMVYGSTTGVYGDCQSQWIDETRAVNPATTRGIRRVHAEAAVQHLGRASGVRTSVLRIPGIYAPDREGGTPRERLLKGTPVLNAADDVFTNHIHADDLARACWLALWRGKPQRNVNVCDHTELKMGDYMDLAAELYGLPKPPRIGRAEATKVLPPMQLSFMSESRRINNKRMVNELGLKLRHPTVEQGLNVSRL